MGVNTRLRWCCCPVKLGLIDTDHVTMIWTQEFSFSKRLNCSLTTGQPHHSSPQTYLTRMVSMFREAFIEHNLNVTSYMFFVLLFFCDTWKWGATAIQNCVAKRYLCLYTWTWTEQRLLSDLLSALDPLISNWGHNWLITPTTMATK